jgi:hypothetical protein
MLVLVLLILAVVCLAAAALGVTVRRVHLGWLGVALFVLTVLIPKL